jgi:hypothetical protein
LTNEDDAMAALGTLRAPGIDYFVQSLDFQIDAGSLVLPDSSGTTIDLSSPFSFRGVITGRSIAGTTLTLDLFAAGTATATFAGNDWARTTYAFDAAAPTPEPGTLILLGGPALFALLRSRRKNPS